MSFSGTASPALRRALTPAQAAFALILGFGLLHLWVIGRIDLGVDEAHYALYGQMLDWSYFDHPPMVGWLQALVLIFSDSEFALRLWPVALTGGAALVLYRLAAELFPDESPWIPFAAVAVLQSAVIFQLVGLAMVPEDPLLLFGLGAALTLLHAVRTGRTRDWLLLGLLFGFAGLSKYTAVVLVVTAVAWLASERRLSLLRTRGPWLAALVAFLSIAPVLVWNAQYEWISFAYQWGHGAPDRDWDAVRFLRSSAGQLLAYGPGVVIFGMLALFAARREWHHRGVRFSLLLALPLLLLFGWGAGFNETLPHWTLLGWAALAPLTGRWLVSHWPRRGVRVGVGAGLAYSLLLVGVIHAQVISPWLPFAKHQHPFGDLYGWRDAAERAVQLRDASGIDDAQIFVGNWSLASRIAWYGRAPVLVTDTRVDQFDLWYGTPKPGAAGVVVVPETYAGRSHANGTGYFEQCEELDVLPWMLGTTRVHTFHFYRCLGYQG